MSNETNSENKTANASMPNQPTASTSAMNQPTYENDVPNMHNETKFMMPAASMPKLDGKNYQSWIEMINIVLELKQLSHVLDGSSADTTSNLQARLLILAAMDESHRSQVRGCTTAKAILERLALIYADKSAANVYRLLMQYYRYDKKPQDSISEHIGRMDEMRRQLADLGEKQTEAVYQVTLIGSLPREYSSIMEVWELTHESMRTTSNLVSRLLKREEDVKKRAMDEDKLFAARTPKPRMSKDEIDAKKRVTNCAICKERGHWARECPKNQSARVDWGSKAMMASEFQQGEKAGPGRTTASPTDEQEITFNVSIGYHLHDKWVSDSGASAHMCNDQTWFCNISQSQTPKNVTVGDGRKLKIHGTGTVRLQALIGDQWSTVILKNVIYVPGLATNLFSIGAAADRGVDTSFRGNECIMSKSGRVAAMGAKLTDKLYLMRFRRSPLDADDAGRALTTIEESMESYHKRLGHASAAKIKTLLRGLEMKVPSGEKVDCAACPAGKGQHSSHPSTGPRAAEVGHLHVDLSGKVNKVSLKGYYYYLLCKDEMTSFVSAYFCKTKSEVPFYLQKLINEFEMIAKQPVRTVQSDKGSEFINSVTNLLFAKEKVIHTTSAEYCPQQNGRIEREMRTITEMARTMLVASRLPTELWPEAVAHAVYIKNRLPTKGETLTPYEKIFGKKPYIDNLFEFGTPAHVIINDRYLTKWDPRTIEGHIVGCCPRRNTYKVYIPSRNRVVETSDVIIARHTERGEDQTTGKQVGDPPAIEIPLEKGKTGRVPSDEKASLEITQPSGTPTRIMMQSTPKVAPSPQPIAEPTPGRTLTGQRLADFFEQFRLQQIPESIEIETDQPQEPTYDSADHQRQQIDITQRPLPPLPVTDEGNTTQRPLPPLPVDNEGDTTLPLSTMTEDEQSFLLMSNHQGHDAHGLMSGSDDDLPVNYQGALNRADSENWRDAIKCELDAHEANGTWECVPRPDGARTLTTKWVFTIKRDGEGKLVKHKARLVARGFEQRRGIDFEQTFAPVARLDSLRTLLALAATRKLEILQFDISTAFLQGELVDKVLIDPPEGVKIPGGMCLKLNKALYGLKQAPRAWNSTFTAALATLSFSPTKMDACVFVDKSRTMFMLCWVDDCLLMGPDKGRCQYVIDRLATRFCLKQLGGDYFLGIKIERTKEGIRLSQTHYAREIAARFNLIDAKAPSAPIADTKILMMAEPVEPTRAPFRQAIGCLQYLACCTRPDLLFAVGFLARFNSHPADVHWQAAKTLIKYAASTADKGILYRHQQKARGQEQASGKDPKADLALTAYSDSDLANDTRDRKSTSGVVIALGGGPIIFLSRKQKDVATGSTHAEYYAAYTAACELKWLTQLLKELGVRHNRPVLHVDNKSTIFMVENPDTKRRSKHIDIKYHFIREQANRRLFDIAKIDGTKNPADALTKPLSRKRIEFLFQLAGWANDPS